MTARLWSWWTRAFARKSGRTPARRPASIRLGVEALEDRAVPSTTALPMTPRDTPVYPPVQHGPILGGHQGWPPLKVPGSHNEKPKVYVTSTGFTFSVLDSKNNPVASYRGTVRLTVLNTRTGLPVSCATLDLPNAYTYTARDAGSHNFRVTAPPGTYLVKIVDTANAQIHGSVTISVSVHSGARLL